MLQGLEFERGLGFGRGLGFEKVLGFERGLGFEKESWLIKGSATARSRQRSRCGEAAAAKALGGGLGGQGPPPAFQAWLAYVRLLDVIFTIRLRTYVRRT